MATASFGARFFKLSVFRPVVAIPAGIVRLRKSERRERFHLVVSTRMLWHPAVGYRTVTVYQRVPLGPSAVEDVRRAR